MRDRDTVIKGLECIIGIEIKCRDCGYSVNKGGHSKCHQDCAKDAIALLKEHEAIESIDFGNRTEIMANLEGLTWNDWRMYHSDTEVQNIAKSVFDLLIALLKEQEPMKVKTDMYGNAYCPWCSTDRTIEMGAQRLHLGTHFCPYCGKAVKWDD